MTSKDTSKTSGKLPFFHPIILLATWFGAGRSKYAPGTVGSIAALPFAYAIHTLIGEQALLAASLVLFLIGVPICERYIRQTETPSDPKEVVIDEVAGQWLILVAFPATLAGYLFGLLLFRIFDILKPWPVSLCDRADLGGFGVMLDDMVAAIYPVILLGLIAMFCAATGMTFLADFYGFLAR